MEMEARLMLRLEELEERLGAMEERLAAKQDRTLEKLNDLEWRMEMVERNTLGNEMGEEEEVKTAVGVISDDEEDDSWPSDREHTAREKGLPRDKDDAIGWSSFDEGIRQEQEERAANTTSMWAYDPRRLPDEFVDLDQDTFLTDRSGKNLCFLPTEILIKICAMLSVLDFVNLSLACRYLHWRLFTFCTCYTPYTVEMEIDDSNNHNSFWRRDAQSRMSYIFQGYAPRLDALPTEAIREYYMEQLGLRRFFVYQPACLRKPFFFESLKLKLKLPFYEKVDYDRCLEFILPLRKLARHLELEITYECSFSSDPFLDFSATNEFFKMDRVSIPAARRLDVYIFLNRIGDYGSPSNDAVKRTLKEFFYGPSNLEFHNYRSIRRDDLDQDRYPLLEYLFDEYKDFEEYYSEDLGHIWYTTIVTEETGRRHRMRISKRADGASVCIGKEETFIENDKKEHWWFYHYEEEWLKMETAVGPEEDEAETEEDEQAEPGGAMTEESEENVAEMDGGENLFAD